LRGSRFLKLASYSPAAAILEIWKELEFTAADAVSRYQPNDKNVAWNQRENTRYLERLHLLNSEEMVVYSELRSLRNRAVHLSEGKISVDAVVDYLDAADRLINTLRHK
jgi:uncharacterized protein YutE (UPF0331/DUF86 family)